MIRGQLWRWFLILLLVSGVISLLMTVELLPKPDNTYFWRAFFDGGHAPLFGTMSLVMLWLCRLLPVVSRKPVPVHYVIAAIGATLFGIGVEISQIGTARDADPMDVARDIAGVIPFLLIAATFDPRLRTACTHWFNHRWLLRGAALIIFAIPFIPATQWAIETISRNVRFPVIADFESRLEIMPMAVNTGDARRIHRPSDFTIANGEMVEDVLLRPADSRKFELRYPTFQIEEPYPDWTGYDSLLFSIQLLDSVPREIWIRIHDRKHNSRPDDRFNRRLTLAPGQQRIAISMRDIRFGAASRELQMNWIRSVRLFLNPNQPEIRFLLDYIHLK